MSGCRLSEMLYKEKRLHMVYGDGAGWFWSECIRRNYTQKQIRKKSELRGGRHQDSNGLNWSALPRQTDAAHLITSYLSKRMEHSRKRYLIQPDADGDHPHPWCPPEATKSTGCGWCYRFLPSSHSFFWLNFMFRNKLTLQTSIHQCVHPLIHSQKNYVAPF